MSGHSIFDFCFWWRPWQLNTPISPSVNALEWNVELVFISIIVLRKLINLLHSIWGCLCLSLPIWLFVLESLVDVVPWRHWKAVQLGRRASSRSSSTRETAASGSAFLTIRQVTCCCNIGRLMGVIHPFPNMKIWYKVDCIISINNLITSSYNRRTNRKVLFICTLFSSSTRHVMLSRILMNLAQEWLSFEALYPGDQLTRY